MSIVPGGLIDVDVAHYKPGKSTTTDKKGNFVEIYDGKGLKEIETRQITNTSTKDFELPPTPLEIENTNEEAILAMYFQPRNQN